MTEDEIKAEFERQHRAYSALEEEAKFVLQRALRQKKIKTHSIPTRVKELTSFLDKVKRKDAKEPFEDIRDIVGLRVICLFLSDIPRIGEVIRESFNVLSEDDKIEGVEISSFGYLSLHFNAEMRKEYKGPRYDAVAGMPFEIQVRTILMEAWANVSHYLDYKSDVDVPTALRRDFYALSGLFYVADSHFELFFKSSKDSSKQMSALASESKPDLVLQETRRAALVLPFVIRRTPFRPPSQVTFSHLRQWHSSGRIPVSKSTSETSCKSGKATARYCASSLEVMTRSRRCSPPRNLTFGEVSSTPHSTARRRTRRKARRQLFSTRDHWPKVSSPRWRVSRWRARLQPSR
jgi:ppGpp synthetase/RelA/SpoT-type nucleotidyltranferase